jgi:hypothetical protein
VKAVRNVTLYAPLLVRFLRIYLLHLAETFHFYIVQVRVVMLPSKRQKHKTKVRQGNNPQYMESFLLHKVNPGKLIKVQRPTDSAKIGFKLKSH